MFVYFVSYKIDGNNFEDVRVLVPMTVKRLLCKAIYCKGEIKFFVSNKKITKCLFNVENISLPLTNRK